MLYSSVKNHQMNIKDIQVIIIVYDYMCPYWGMFNTSRSFLYSSSKHRHKFVLNAKQFCHSFYQEIDESSVEFPK